MSDNQTKTIGAIVLACLSLSGCTRNVEVDTPMRTETRARQVESLPLRFEITRVGIIKDDLAYGGRRGIYLIVDTKTGKEFVGVSGVGINEIGSHVCGKGCIAEDER